MGFKTDYKDITLKKFCNLVCIGRQTRVRIMDYYTDEIIEKEIEVDAIPEDYAAFIIEDLRTWPVKNDHNQWDSILLITVRREYLDDYET